MWLAVLCKLCQHWFYLSSSQHISVNIEKTSCASSPMTVSKVATWTAPGLLLSSVTNAWTSSNFLVLGGHVFPGLPGVAVCSLLQFCCASPLRHLRTAHGCVSRWFITHQMPHCCHHVTGATTGQSVKSIIDASNDHFFYKIKRARSHDIIKYAPVIDTPPVLNYLKLWKVVLPLWSLPTFFYFIFAYSFCVRY